MAKFDKKIHSILVKRQVLPQDQADQCLEESVKAENGKGFVDVLLEKKAVQEADLIGCIGQETGIPPIDLSKVSVGEDVLQALPKDLSEYYGVLPVSRVDGLLTLAVANPFDVVALDDIEIVTGCKIRPVVSTESAIRQAITRCYNPGEAEMKELLETNAESGIEFAEEKQEEAVNLDEITGDESSPVVKLVNLMIAQAIKEKASDIHIEPFEKKLLIRFRADGALHEALSPPKKMQNAIVSRIKIMAALDIAEKMKPQDGKFQLKVDGRQVDFRVSILPVVHGEKVVMRLLDSSNLTLNLDSLGFEPKSLDDFRWAIAQPYGMLLVTGPTGSGKSTTLYSAVRELMDPEENLITVEDPVEYQLEGINQVAVNVKRGLTFAAALRSILRQDPDIIMIGEIRDKETIDIAVKAALTGHQVLSTLHTNDAASTITRMVDMDVDPFLVASATLVVSAQRLVKKLCAECKEPADAPKERLLAVGFTPEECDKPFFKAKGCSRCKEGYKGRFALLETLRVDDDIKRMIIKGSSALDIKKAGIEKGMITLRRCGILNVLKGRTSVEEVLAITAAD